MPNTGKWETMIEISGWRNKHKNMSEWEQEKHIPYPARMVDMASDKNEYAGAAQVERDN